MQSVIDFDIDKFDAILQRGLCSGIGDPHGQMCIEAAICAVLNQPHGDKPYCVTQSVRIFKIALNDARWSSPEARAKGLRNLGIAQLGSKGVVDDAEFSWLLTERTIQLLLPVMFRKVFSGSSTHHVRGREAADKMEQEPTRRAALDAANAAHAAADAARFINAANVNAFATIAGIADNVRNGYCCYDYSRLVHYMKAIALFATIDAKSNPDEYLLLSARIALDVLRELKSPGCELLDA